MQNTFAAPSRYSIVSLALIALFLVGAHATAAQAATTYYVSTKGSDSNSGTKALPFLTIQKGITAAASKDTVMLLAGTYTGTGDWDLDTLGKAITITSLSGAASTIIDCGAEASVSHYAFDIHGGETNTTIISNLTLTESSGESGMVEITNSSPDFKSCNFIEPLAKIGGFSAAITTNGSAAVPLLVDSCYFSGNGNSTAFAGCVSVSQTATVTLVNSSFYNNFAEYAEVYVAHSGSIYGTLTATNCTFTANLKTAFLDYGNLTLQNTIAWLDSGGEITVSGVTATVNYSDIQGGYAGTGNINADPFLYNSNSTDLHLASTVSSTGSSIVSPCLGAGSATGAPSLAEDGVTRPNPPSIGAYEVEKSPVATQRNVPADFATIQAAINAANTGDTVSIAAGTYTGAGNWDMDTLGKAITITSVSGAATTIIDCGAEASVSNYAFDIHGAETNTTLISNLTLTESTGQSGMVEITNSSPDFKSCSFIEPLAKIGGFSAAIFTNGSAAVPLLIDSCYFAGNGNSTAFAGCVYVSQTATVSLVNSSFYDNFAEYVEIYVAHSGAIYGTLTATNCTFTANQKEAFYDYGNLTLVNTIAWLDSGGEITVNGVTATVTYSDIQGGYAGTGNINADPQFYNASTPDLHLASDSPCLGAGLTAGAPKVAEDGAPRPTPPSIGAYEGDVQLVSLIFTPNTVAGGGATVGKVTLTNPAPAGGTKVTLTSKTPSALPVPASVLVAAGAKTASFNATSKVVTATTKVVVTAAFGGVTKSATVTVTNLGLETVTLNPTSVSGGFAVQGTVTLGAAATAATTITLVSSSPTVASVPASVTIAAGATSAEFAVSTTAVTAVKTVTITATLNGVSKTATLTVTRPTVATLIISPSTVMGGSSSSGIAVLNTPAPTGGIAVTLTSGGPAATVPATVTVAAGQSSVMFTIQTTAVTTNTIVNIEAATGSVNQSGALTILP